MVAQRIIVLKLTALLLLLFINPKMSQSQTSGNAVYGNNNNPYYKKQNHRTSSIQSGKTFLISADVLFHAKADRYVAVFGIVQENKSVKECSEVIEKRIAKFNKSMLG